MEKAKLLSVLKDIAKAIVLIDRNRAIASNYGSKVNADRANEARRNLINILFSNGYELEAGTFKVIESPRQRPLLGEGEHLSQKFKIGQKVRVVARTQGHNFEIGETLEVVLLDPNANSGKGDYLCRNEKKRWYLVDDELEAVEE
jgi:hypothetical protein